MLLIKYCKISCTADVYMDGASFPAVQHTLELGVIVSSHLSHSAHITNIIANVHVRYCVRSFMITSIYSCVPSVGPTVERNSINWLPSTIRNIDLWNQTRAVL